MQELEKRIEELKEKAMQEGKNSDNRHIKDYSFGKCMAYMSILWPHQAYTIKK